MKRNITILLTTLAIAVMIACSGSDDWLDLRENFVVKAGELSKVPAKTELSPEPFIMGKLVVLTNSGNGFSISDTFFDELKEVHARKPEDVGTVALLDCKKEKDGVYVSKTNPNDKVDAFKTRCEPSLIDRVAQTLYFKKMFEAPVREEARGQGNYVFAGAETEFEVRSFLKRLPKK